MSISRFGAALVCGLAITACSQKAPAGAAATASGGGGASPAATTIAIPANKDVATVVSLPAGTHGVQIVSGAGAFHCAHMTLQREDGGVSNNFTDADVPAHTNMTDTTTPGHSYVSIDLS